VAEGVARRRAQAVVVAAATLLIAAVAFPLWRPLLVAAVLAGVLAPKYEASVGRLHGHRSLVAALFTAATIVLILIPLAGLAMIAVHEATNAIAVVKRTLAAEGMAGLIARAPDPIEGWLHRMVPSQLDAARPLAASGRWAVGALSSVLAVMARFGLQLALMLIAFFFLLRDGRALLEWLIGATPLAPDRIRWMMREFRGVSRSVLGANFVTGAVQAIVATIGFAIGHAPSPVFFGLLTLFSSFVPSIGTMLVTLPVAGLVLLLGRHWAALFLAIWAVVVVGLIDNVIRPLLIRGQGQQLHGALIFFSLIGAMSAFGAIGIFLGPLALAFFLAVVRTRRQEREGFVQEV
jgi:predicted PurR-regulated permease PerM